MSREQHAAYRDTTSVASDALGLISRDNPNHRRKRGIIQWVAGLGYGDRILEVGCGSGLHTEGYSRQYDVTAVDISPSLVRTTRQRAPDADVVQADATQLSFPDGTFDAVVGTAILHHLPDARAALREWLRVTQSGGTVTLMEPNYLFPKDFVSAHLVPEERHKTQMAPWRVRRILEDVAPGDWRHEPRLYTPPWPERLLETYEAVDSVLQTAPGLRWLGMMQVIHLEVPA